MPDNIKELKQQIRFVAGELDLEDFVVEKDVFVTKAISIVSQISHELYDLMFQGGTSLAKAHRIIERMSEDCDFRIRLKDSGGKLSKEFSRKALRSFRHELVDALKSSGFRIEKDDIRVRNEGQFMGIRANYPSLYSTTLGIKP